MGRRRIYAIPTWTRTVALVREHAGLLAALGSDECPSVYACYRFATKLREHQHLLDACVAAVVERVKFEVPGIGEDVAIDASDMPPCCEHGNWRFAGADYKRQAAKWRCPTGECQPASVWIKVNRLHPLIPRETLRWRGLYKKRGAVEREFGRLKNEWALAPLRVRGMKRVRLHADLTILAKLSCALARARAVPLAG